MIKIRKIIIALALIVFTSTSAMAQTEGAVFNPMSQYGLGDLATIGTAASKGMGGVALAARDRFAMNLLNPASYNSSDRQNVLFSAGGTGTSNYLKSNEYSNSHNYFSLGHIGMQLRLSKKLGFGFVITPYSDMGYEMTKTITQNDVITNIGNVRYDFVGSGGVAQFKSGISANLFKGFNIGVNYVYYVGSFTESSATTFSQYISSLPMKNIYTTYTSEVNLSSVELGVQYTTKTSENGWLNFGATFQPKVSSEMDKTSLIATSYSGGSIGESDIIENDIYGEKFYIPMKFGFGVNHTTNKLVLGVDYTYQQWSDAFPENSVEGISYQNSNIVRIGAQYIPNRFDIRYPLKRLSYRAGLVYGSSYVVKNGVKTNEISGTLGLGIPIEKDWFSQIDISAEVGSAGTLSNELVRNTFVKLNIGITFAARNWFLRFKYY